MTIKNTTLAMTAVAAGLIAAPVAAHLRYHGVIPLKSTATKISGSLNAAPTASSPNHAGNWAIGVKSGLGAMETAYDGSAPVFLRFHLDKDAIVNLSATPAASAGSTTTPKDRSSWQGAAVIDPAISLYQGLLPFDAMDSWTMRDTAQATDDISIGFDPYDMQVFTYYWGDPVLTAVSRWDGVPNDPAIPHLILQVDDTGQPVMDPMGGGYAKVLVNPDWKGRTLADLAADSKYSDDAALQALVAAGEGDLTPKQWYDKHYVPHNGYRDTLNYTGIGGAVTPDDPRLADPSGLFYPGSLPNASGRVIAIWAWFGEIDPVGDFSLSNGEASGHPDTAASESIVVCPPEMPTDCNPAGVDWAKVYHVGHANDHDSETYPAADGSGPLPAQNLTSERLHNQLLAKGDYSILLADGCSQCADDFGFTHNTPVVVRNAISGMNFALQAWPVKDCNNPHNSGGQPEIAPVSGPWDVNAGQSLSIPLGAHSCGNNAPQFSVKGLDNASFGDTQAITDRTGKTEQQLGWQSSLSWTAPPVAKVTVKTIKISAGDGSKKSRPQTAKVRIWPQGVNPGNSFTFTPPTITWDGNRNKLKITAKVKLANANVLLPEEKAAIYGRPLRLLGTESVNVKDGNDHTLGYDTSGNIAFGPFADAKGKIALTTLLDATAVPCKIQWSYGQHTGMTAVTNAPQNCVK